MISNQFIWNGAHCAVRGRGHIKNGKPCQDKTLLYRCNDTTVLVLSDGAGSASKSHYGAECVCKGVSRLLSERFDEINSMEDGAAAKELILEYINSLIQKNAEELGAEQRELSATMLAVAVKDGCGMLLHVGDGVIGCIKDNKLMVASAPDNGEFANETVFVNAKSAISRFVLKKFDTEKFEGFILMSDGAGNSLYNHQTHTLSKASERLIKSCTILKEADMNKELCKLLRLLIRNKTMDDCSVAVLGKDIFNIRPHTDKEIKLLNAWRKKRFEEYRKSCSTI